MVGVLVRRLPQRYHRAGPGAMPEGEAMLAERMLMGLLIGGVAVGCGVVLYPFWSALLWAAILAYASWPVFLAVRRTLRLGDAASAAVMVLGAALVIALPLALAVPRSAADVEALRGEMDSLLREGLPPAPGWLFEVPLLGGMLHDYWASWAADISGMVRFFAPYFGSIAQSGLELLLAIAGGVLNIVAALFIAYFFWWGGEAMAGGLTRLLARVAGDRAGRLLLVTTLTVRGVVYGILGTAIVQGVLTAFGLWLVGIPRAALLGAVAAALAVLPVGAPVVWIPAGIWLLATGHTARGVFLLVYGVGVVSGADSVLRPYFISRGAKLPFLLTMLGVLGGALAFGLLGVFLGPVLLGLGFSLMREFVEAEA